MVNDKDIEYYLAQLEDGWLSEDGLEAEDSEDDDPPNPHYTRDELLSLLDDNNGDEDTQEENENDPPLVEELVEDRESQSRVPCGDTGDTFNTLLDKRKLIWKNKDMNFDEDRIAFLGSSAFPSEISQLETPYQCFKYFFDDDFIQEIVTQTNLYVMQKDLNNKIIYTVSDIKKFFGILLFMSVQKFQNTRSYWSPAFGYSPVSSTMPVNKFEKIKLSLHFQNNENHKPVGHADHDRLFKIRPVIEHLKAKFSTIPMEQRLSVDEQMCATKVAHFLKQYLPNKPHKWGFKFYVLCDLSGYAHTFELYSGQENTGRPEGEPDLGATGNVVIRLLRGVPRHQNHIIYFDNFYTSLPLVHHLAKQGIQSVGTVQQNRIPNSKLPDKKEFMKKSVPRGSHVERTTTFDGIDMSCVTWKDNKMVTLLSTYVGSTPVSSVTRYDKAKKEKVEISCPKIVQEYNKHMGGVDLMDSFLGRFHIAVRSKKWYLRIFFHLLDLTVINAWIIYKKNAMMRNMPKKNILSMGQFRNELAQVLCSLGSNTEVKRGRPSSSSLEIEIQAKKKRGPAVVPPPKDIRRDGSDHWPQVGVSLRCKYPKCKGYSTISCNKCRVNLCLNKNNNCFVNFHEN